MRITAFYSHYGPKFTTCNESSIRRARFRRQWTRASDPLNFSKTTYQSQTIYNFKHAVNKGIHVLEHIIRVLQ